MKEVSNGNIYGPRGIGGDFKDSEVNRGLPKEGGQDTVL
jgi:hypothetical protein